MTERTFAIEGRIRHYPVDGDKAYVDVVLVEDCDALNAFATHALNRKRLARRAAGVFLTWKGARRRIGTIVLSREHLNANAVSHEASHAVWEIARWYNIPMEGHKREEWFCTTLGHLVGDIHANWRVNDA